MRHDRYPKSILFSWILVFVLTAFAAHAEDEDVSSAPAQAYRDGYNLILDNNWDGAIAAFTSLVDSYADSEWADDACFWRCYARGENGEPSEDVFACYEKHLEHHPRSEWNDDAKRSMVRLAHALDREGRREYREKVSDFGRGEDDRQLLQVLVALAEIGDERSVGVILERLDATEDEHLRARIVDVLEDVIDQERVVVKIKVLVKEDPSERVRIAAVDTLSAHESESTVGLLKEILTDSSQPQRVRAEALDELIDHNPPGLVDLLREMAKTGDKRVAAEAIDGIADREDLESLEILIELLGDIPDVRRRIWIVDEIEDFNMDEAVDALLHIAKSDPDPRVRRAATDALGDMDHPGAREALIQLLQEFDN